MNLLNRITHMIRPARITAPTDETGTISRVQAKHNPFDTRQLSSMQLVGFASALPVNTDVMTIQVGGDNSNGVVIASNHQQYRPQGLLTGETMIYDCQETRQSIRLQADGMIVITGVHNVTITCDTEVTITCPTVLIQGDLHVTGAVVAGYGTGDSVTVQGHRHGEGSAAAGTIAPTAGT